jgi:Ca2+/Na+ antiporter
MEKEFYKEMREYAWNYFIAFAEARLSTFRFYLVFCTILIAGLAALLSTDVNWLAIPLSFLLSFLSFIYWKVDVRHKELIKQAEQALEYLEKKFPLPKGEKQPHVLQLFYSETEREKSYRRFPKYFSPKAHFSYSTSVNLVFGIFGLGGIILATVLLIRL